MLMARKNRAMSHWRFLSLGCSKPAELPPSGTDRATGFETQQEIDSQKMLDDIRAFQPDYEDPEDSNVFYDDWQEIVLPATP